MKISILTHPNSKKPRIEKGEEILHVYVSEREIEGRANKAVIKAIAMYFNVRKNK